MKNCPIPTVVTRARKFPEKKKKLLAYDDSGDDEDSEADDRLDRILENGNDEEILTQNGRWSDFIGQNGLVVFLKSFGGPWR